jgi:hypothetical protein
VSIRPRDRHRSDKRKEGPSRLRLRLGPAIPPKCSESRCQAPAVSGIVEFSWMVARRRTFAADFTQPLGYLGRAE